VFRGRKRCSYPCLHNNEALFHSPLKFFAINEVFLVSRSRRRCSAPLHLNPRSVTDWAVYYNCIFGKHKMINAFKGKYGLLCRFIMQLQHTTIPSSLLGETTLHHHLTMAPTTNSPTPISSWFIFLLNCRGTDATQMLHYLQINKDWHTQAGIGIFIVNTDISTTISVFIKAHMQRATSVIMAETTALALAVSLLQHMQVTDIHFLVDN
jgi:hypothetical protein